MTTSPAAPSAVDPGFATEFATRWLEAWNSHQPARLLELVAEDIEYDDSAWPKTMRGHADVREFAEVVWRAFPDLEFELVRGPFLDPSGPRASLWWRCRGTHMGPFDPPGLRPTGKRVEMSGADLHEYRNGKLERLRVVFDMADAMRQLGALPPAGSREERALIGLTNVRRRFSRAQA